MHQLTSFSYIVHTWTPICYDSLFPNILEELFCLLPCYTIPTPISIKSYAYIHKYIHTYTNYLHVHCQCLHLKSLHAHNFRHICIFKIIFPLCMSVCVHPCWGVATISTQSTKCVHVHIHVLKSFKNTCM